MLENAHYELLHGYVDVLLLSKLMLDLAWVVFEQQTSVSGLIHKIMLHTQSLLLCERCQVLLVDDTGKVRRSSRGRYFNQPINKSVIYLLMTHQAMKQYEHQHETGRRARHHTQCQCQCQK